ncbi:hypothetical protein NEOLEDRAFT_1180343 [Neolentinus lepideus HHB14362 ss-1]|uniref:Uncharacterized protein n=1 Tax=Neolentinus lepideus HHB14362 ss-1 TaxID=1314782 RepID=A0A165QZW4_9AGAM|nr:hypothetical protein NEOLEDRAFT_1180343 [Neolentinus lepideus HHB14362 ss-1]
MDMLYGRHRKSIVDIEGELLDIFYDHPESHENDAGLPVIPANHLVDVFRTYSENHDGLELITTEEEEQLNQLIESNPGLEVTPQVLIEFIAMRAAAKAREEAAEVNRDNEQQEMQEREEEGGEDSEGERGRSEYWEGGDGYRSRSSSEDSGGTSVYRSRPPSRGPPVPPKTPGAPTTPFDGTRRQRTTPLGPPSSWTAKRPVPASRRKSVDGGHSRALSDSEFMSDSPSSWSGNKSGRRSRAPSNPTSPKSQSTPTLPSMNHFVGSSPSSYSRPPSRPQSRSESRSSQRSNSLGSRLFGTPPPHGDDSGMGMGITPPSPEIDISSHMVRRQQQQHQDPDDDLSLSHGVNSLPMPRGSDSDSDSDSEDRTLGLVMDRSAASSTVSLEPTERLEALQKTNQELGRKLMEAERMLQLRLNEHELELEEMQGRLEEAKSELSATKREEKELRAKEKQNSSQILALESEIAKLQKSLDNSRTAYQSLQKQYQEQCAESERYRNALRRRDEEIKDLQEASALQSLEAQKLSRESDNYEERINILESELVAAQQTHAQLEEQKQENMLLKETIDRMRFDMDELRTSAASQTQGGTGTGASAKNTISKSLGAELLGKMKGAMWDGEEEEAEDEGEGSESTTAVEEEESSGTEGEDVIQTIITRTKKRVARSGKVEKVMFEEVKQYTDTAIQYDALHFFASSSTQTDSQSKILMASTIVQTETPPVRALEIQTETETEPAPAAKTTVDMDIQTDLVAAAVSTQEEDALASSSSTVLPPTPKSLTPDLPPSYSQTQEDEKQLRIAAETLHKWHPGVIGPFETVATGVSEDAIEEWKALKDELGIDCIVIDKIIEDSPKTGEPRSSKDHKRRKSSRFYNIYNTYVYGSKDGNESSFPVNITTQALLCVGVSALVLLAIRPIIAPHSYIHGSPSYYDRMAWSSFNSMYPHAEGFSPDGTAAVWKLFGRLGGGAARIARGWPT